MIQIVCNKLDNERVLAMHYLGPNAGEVTQVCATFPLPLSSLPRHNALTQLIHIHPHTHYRALALPSEVAPLTRPSLTLWASTLPLPRSSPR